jgi:ADP-heptose:LPS heptosyltransferase
VKKILVIRLSSIGDIVLTSAVVRCIKQQLPGADVHFAVKRAFLPVVEASPYIDRIHIFEGDIHSFVAELRAEKFDFIADLHQSLRSRRIRMKLRVPSKGFPKLNFRKWLLTGLKINIMPPVHVVDRYFRAVAPLGVVNDGKGLEYFISPGDEFDLQQLPPAFRNGFVAFAIGAKHATKRLPEHKIIEICTHLHAPVILLGGPEDEERANRVAQACGPEIISLCGRISLSQSASLVRQSTRVITHDTGLMHIAAAFRKKIISVWGNTVPEFGMYPYMPGDENNSVIIGVKNLKCRPCSKLGYDRCPKGHFRCMEEIDVKEVVRTWREEGR